MLQKDGLDWFADKEGRPEVLLYAPDKHREIYDYITENKIKKIALCGGGTPTQPYLDTIKSFAWVEWIYGYTKGLDFSFMNSMGNLKRYIGTLDFRLESESLEELYAKLPPKAKISGGCKSLKTLSAEKCKSVAALFPDGTFPENLRSLCLIQGGLQNLGGFFENDTIENLELVLQPKLQSLQGIGRLRALKKIRLEKCKSLADLSSLQNMPKLQELLVVGCPAVDTKVLDSLRGLPRKITVRML